MSKAALIAIGYNKVDSLLRLLDSLNNADYGGDTVPLIISLDKSDSDDVLKAAESFTWSHGTKEIRTFPTRQGLKHHILSCGDYLEQYEAVFIFEDDIMASPSFYKFGKSCIDYYQNSDEIAGISLYSPTWNQNANFPFEPLKSEYDTYFIQYAQSWGQIWFRNSWKDFKAWYENNQDFFSKEPNPNIPANLYAWGKNSWLKYHIVYCILMNKFFVYPYYSFTTAFVENGTHFGTDITRFQSNLMINNVANYKLAPITDCNIFYDAFFENMYISAYLNTSNADVQIDLYGSQNANTNKKYILTTQILPFTVVRNFALQLRPIELNIIMGVKGTGIYLYDTLSPQKIRAQKHRMQIVKKWDYFMKERFLMWNEIFPMCHQKISNLINIFIHKLTH